MTSRSIHPTAASKVTTAVAVMAVSVMVLVSCSSSASSAQKVCDAKDNVKSAISSVQSDVRAGNFGQARDGLSDVQKAFDQLESEAKNLASDEKTKLQPQIDAITTSVTDLKSATSLSDLTTDLSTIGTQLQTLYTDLTNDLHCG